MNRFLTLIFILFFLFTKQSIAQENIMILKLKDGDVKIELFEDVAPNHVKRIKELADSGQYDNVVFHRVIDGFMAQTGDVKFGKSDSNDFDLRRAGMGGSDMPDLKQEFSSVPHDRGTLSMARSSDPDSANSQFFICFKPAPFLDRQYTVFGKVLEGMEFVDKIKRGDDSNNGAVSDPDKIISFKSL
ncbi:peptidylprolyl isomerase [Candidatus Pelagibacter sp.]|jgi:peptidyl-prolyl cis-trans isomerase B (cyclophilin B)|nr:peptidylprolyl isomerase [Candidatus Pelagibacter bacterium]MDB9792857.1 peptidylprolyl isomerase [Candidatus Pelagibacter sp.]MDC1045287.1 peptidylprolyl isomerase [Candidatus Pelagibacter sp.]MDC1053539.1 peptidylprolyl isomerase [Candidatus Pelagibacter sp.]MDC1137468.1 peptidylprolyl isomerase [Candidatus Pelagibacter sp.]